MFYPILSLTRFLLRFDQEQVNSEDNLRTILAKVRDENKTPGLLRQLDYELGQEASPSPVA
jgi:ferritin